jgi:hypothetical protein
MAVASVISSLKSTCAVSCTKHQPFFLPESMSALRARTSGKNPSLLLQKNVLRSPPGGLPSWASSRPSPLSKQVHERSTVRRPKFAQRRRAQNTEPPSASTALLESARASLERSLALDADPDVEEASGAALTALDDNSVSKTADLQRLDGLNAAAGLEQQLLGHSSEPQTDEDIMAMSLADSRRNLFTGDAHT